jgi:RNA polymerase sigma-70 factor (ECF subfamily)
MADDRTEDPALLERLARGDSEALAALFALHRERLRRMIEFRLHPKLVRRLDPDDVLQEAWLDAQKRIASYAEQDDPSCLLWLRLVVGQTLVDVHRRHLGAKMRDANQEIPLSGLAGPRVHSETMSVHLTAGLTSPSQAAAREEAGRMLQDVLAKMDPIDREILVLRHFEELTNAEVAKILDLRPSAASNRYIRALGRLRGLASGLPGLGQPPSTDS